MKRTTKTTKTNEAAPKEYTLSDGITQSMLSNFIKCRVAAQLSLQRWGSPAPRRATQFGSLFHVMLQDHYRSGGSANPLSTFKTVATRWERQAVRAGDTIQDIQKDLACATALFPAYVEHWKKSDQKKTWLEVEQVFDIKYEGVRLRGKLDGLFQTKDGSVWILETKTASQISEDTLNLALTFDFQCLFYIIAIMNKFKCRVNGVLYNVIRTPQIGRKEDKGSSAYVQLLREDIQSRPNFYFQRFELSFPKQKVDLFGVELGQKLEDFIAWWDGKLPTYKNEFACRARWNCEYLPVCSCGGNPEKAGFKKNKTLFSELLDE